MVLRFIFRGRVRHDTSQVLVYTDTLPFNKKQARGAVEVAIKKSCRDDLGDRPFHVFNHRLESNAWLQVADYCTWAIQRKWENLDDSSYRRLVPRLAATEIDPMSRGDGTVYY